MFTRLLILTHNNIYTYKVLPNALITVTGLVEIHYCSFLLSHAIKNKSQNRIWETKGSEYAKTLAKIQVCAIFHWQDIRNN